MQIATATLLFRHFKFFSLLIYCLSLAGCYKGDESWTDEAKLNNGNIIKVERTVIFHLGDMLNWWPNQYKLKFTNPNNNEIITWKGEIDVHPILLDFEDKNPYLVAYGNSANIYTNPSLFGCPTIPYLFYKYKNKKWELETIDKLTKNSRTANLLFDYDLYWMKGNPTQTPEIIEMRNSNESRGGAFDKKIPTNFDEWAYKDKYREANYRYHNDCRAKRPDPVSSIDNKETIDAAQRINLEVLRSKDFTAPKHLKSEEWSAINWDKLRSEACTNLFIEADPNEPSLDGWKKFKANTKTQKLLPPGEDILCEKGYLWLFSRKWKNNRFYIFKVDLEGNIKYSVFFDMPTSLPGQGVGGMVNTSFKNENGFIFFDWINFKNIGESEGGGWNIYRKLKVRIKEPESESMQTP